MPAYFHKSTGKRVTADEATFDGKRLRDGYNWILEEGETARFSLDMIDGAPLPRHSVFLTDAKKEAASIDEAFRMAVEEEAKGRGMKPTEWMATQSAQDIEKLITNVATRFVARAGATGVASTFSFDAAANKIRDEAAQRARLAHIDDEVKLKVAEARAAHNRKFSFMGDRAPGFDEAAAAIIARSKIIADGAAVLSAIRDAQYS